MTIPFRIRSVLPRLVRSSVLGLGLVAAVGVAALLVACRDQASDALLDSPLAIIDGEWNGDDAAIEGQLELRGNCLFVSPSVGGPGYAGGLPVYLVFARDGLHWDATTQVVRIGSDDFKVGQNVRFGGSYGNQPLGLWGVSWFKRPAADCDTSHVWFVGR